MLSPAEIQRALRLITSPEFKRSNRFPMATIAQMAGVDRTSVYNARGGQLITPRIAAALSPILEAILAGKLRVERVNKHWQVKAHNETPASVEKGGMLERLFPARPQKVSALG